MAKNFKSSINKTDISNKTGIDAIFSSPQIEAIENPESKEIQDVRQTFLVKKSHLKKLKDYVHTRRLNGNTEFTQKEALNEALELLFKRAGTIVEKNNN